MRSIIALCLVALASTMSAGSIRPAACLTLAEQDTGLKDFIRMTNQETCKRLSIPKAECTDAAVKLKDPTASIWPTTIPGYQNYSDTYYCSAVYDHAAMGIAWRNAKQIQDLYVAATPEERAQVDLILKVPQP